MDQTIAAEQCEFWSSVQYGAFLNSLANTMTQLGTPACQRFAVSERDYRRLMPPLSRGLFRLRCYAGYPLQLSWRLLRDPKPTALVVSSNTFYAPAIARIFGQYRGIRRINWMLDLFPDALIATDAIRDDSLPDRVITELIRADLHSADYNVFLGSRLLSAAERRFGPIPRARIIPIGADSRLFSGANAPRLAHDRALRLLYCGNLGRLHDIGTISNAIQLGLPPELTCVFRGSGRGFQELRQRVGESRQASRVRFEKSMAESEWVAEMLEAQIALVTVRPGAETVVMPSKTYSALSAGQAIVAVCPRCSDLADLVIDHKCGWHVAPGDSAGLRDLFYRITADPTELQTARTNALLASRNTFDTTNIARRWCDLLSARQDADRVL